jgi:hypothetical protein
MLGHPVHTQDNIHAFQTYGYEVCWEDFTTESQTYSTGLSTRGDLPTQSDNFISCIGMRTHQTQFA